MASRLAFRASLAVLLTAPALAHAACPRGGSPIRILPLEPAQIAVPVDINGSGPFKFLLDTGSQLTVLEPSLAEQLQLQGAGSIGIVSVAAHSTASLAGLERLAVGNNEIRHSQVAILDLAAIQKLNPTVRGILGQDFLAHFDLLIDQPHLLLCFDQTGRMQRELDGERIPVLKSSGDSTAEPFTEPVLIAARLQGSGPEDAASAPAVLKLDCGGNVALLFHGPLVHARHRHRKGSERMREGSALGPRSSLLFRDLEPRNVLIGTRRLRQVIFLTPASSSDTASRSGEDGLLPTTLFKRVFISNHDRFVIFDPR